MHFSQHLRKWAKAASPTVAILWLSISGFAGTTLNFPRLSFEADALTGVAIANPTDVTAVVTLTAYRGDGSLLSGPQVTNPAQITIEAHEQRARTTSQFFGSGVDAAMVAWFQATSSVDGLTGFFLFLNTSVTFFDGADLPAKASDIVFNLARMNDDWQTELNLINPNSAGTTVEMTLYGGTSPVTKELMLPAKGAARLDAATFFAQAEYPEGAYVRASATVPIAGFELVKGPGDALGLNARPASEMLNTLFFPHFAVLGDPEYPYESELSLVNYGDEVVILTLSAYRSEGTLFGTAEVQNNPVAVTLEPKAAQRVDVASLFGFKGEELRVGWIKVVATSESVNGSLSYSIPSVNAVATVACEPQGRTHALFSHVATTLGYFTGLAILNGGSRAANIRVVVLAEDGERVGTYSGILKPKEKISKQITELVEDSAGRAGGMIWVSSDVPVYMTGLFVNLDTGVLTNVPPQPVPEAFEPDAGQPQLTVTPRLAVLPPNQYFTFQASGGGAVSWSVAGQGAGTISSLGIYHSPAAVPAALPVTVSASSGSLVGAASIDVLRKQDLLGGLGVVQSVAYLSGLRRLYTAELVSANALRAPSESTTNVRESLEPGDVPRLVSSFSGEDIAKMIPFEGVDGTEYLLLAGKTGGRIIRLNPLTGQSTDVATGLNAPSALVLDPISGDLLVAEADRVRSIPAAQLNGGLVPEQLRVGADPSRQSLDLQNGGDGVAVDPCTGKIYLSSPTQGAILVYDRVTGQWDFAATGLNAPGQLLAIYREGFTCPQAFHLLVVEQGLHRILLVVPSEGRVQAWTNAPGINDLAFLPKGSPFSSDAGVFLAEAPDGSEGSVVLAETPDLYSDILINPPTLRLDSARWTTTTDLPIARLLSVSAAPGNGYIYSIGGYVDGHACSVGAGDGRVFFARQNSDGTLDPWQETSSGNTNFKRSAAGVATYNGTIYFGGGAINNPLWDGFVWYAKPTSAGTISGWQRAQALPGEPNWIGSWPVMAAYNGFLYIGGGRNAFNERYTDRLYVAPLGTDGSPGTWRLLSLPTPCFQGQLVFHEMRAYLIVGLDNCDGCVSPDVFTAEVHSDGSLGTWQSTRPLPETARHASAQVVDGHLVVLPGGTAVYESEILGDGLLGPWNALEELPESALPFDQGVYSNGYYYLVGDQNCAATPDRLRTVYFGRVGF